MDYRPLDITIISAEGIKNVNIFFRMSVYVVVSITGDYNIEKKTHVCRHCGTNPKWSHRIKLHLPEPAISDQSLLFQLISHRALGNKEIGVVNVPIRELMSSIDTSTEHIVDYQVNTLHGKPKGSLKFSYKFGEKINESINPNNKIFNEDESIIAYPADMVYMPHNTRYEYQSGQVGGYHYPPHTPGYGGYPQYGYPAAPGYVYASPTMGYAYPPVPRQDRWMMENRMGNGGKLALGLGAGLIGGLMVGDMISDVGERAAYVAEYADI